MIEFIERLGVNECGQWRWGWREGASKGTYWNEMVLLGGRKVGLVPVECRSVGIKGSHVIFPRCAAAGRKACDVISHSFVLPTQTAPKCQRRLASWGLTSVQEHCVVCSFANRNISESKQTRQINSFSSDRLINNRPFELMNCTKPFVTLTYFEPMNAT